MQESLGALRPGGIPRSKESQHATDSLISRFDPRKTGVDFFAARYNGSPVPAGPRTAAAGLGPARRRTGWEASMAERPIALKRDRRRRELVRPSPPLILTKSEVRRIIFVIAESALALSRARSGPVAV